jgi:hypothetical protein
MKSDFFLFNKYHTIHKKGRIFPGISNYELTDQPYKSYSKLKMHNSHIMFHIMLNKCEEHSHLTLYSYYHHEPQQHCRYKKKGNRKACIYGFGLKISCSIFALIQNYIFWLCFLSCTLNINWYVAF